MTTEFVEMTGGKKVAVSFWDNTDTPRAAVVVVHGMCEYIARYNDFCEFLGHNGYNVIGMDNRGFGDTDADARGKGYAGMFDGTVDDIKLEVDMARARWGVERVYVIGHSYGSILTQRFIEKYHDSVSGAILCGTTMQSGFMLALGKKIARRKAKKDPDQPGKFFAKMTFESYDKKIKDGPNGWLNRDKAEVIKYNADEKCAGVGVCSVMFYKEMFEGLAAINKERGKTPSDFKLMIASGTADGVGGYGKLIKKLVKAYVKHGLNPVVKMYEGGRHEILNEVNKGVVYEDFVYFLDKCEKESGK
ncbi:MAG: alpha/beta fold hydrolase [Clostridiales bacterium]|nr:alpha/beta fold hydrolase [Clostridiales bacterium]